MKPFLKILFIALITTTLLQSCRQELFGCFEGEGQTVSDTILLEEIKEIDCSVPIELILDQGDTQQIVIEAQSNVIDKIFEESNVDNGKWDIKIDGCSDINEIKIFATLVALEEIDIQGIGKIISSGSFDFKEKDLKINIDGDIEMIVDFINLDELDIETNGMADINLVGNTRSQTYDINGEADIKALDFISVEADIEVQGMSDFELNVSDKLNMDLTGTGSICIKGAPETTQDISGLFQFRNCN